MSKEDKYVLVSGVFVTAMVVANFVGVKLAQIGPAVISIGSPMIALSFLCTDIIADVWGKEKAKRTIWLGFLANIISLAFVQIAIRVPHPEYWTQQKEFAAVFGGQLRLIVASLITYLASQYVDMGMFFWIKRKTRSRHLWLRNNISTFMCQAVDTVLFTLLAFGGTMALAEMPALMVGQYGIRLILALLDTPLVYLGVSWVKRD